MFDLMIKSMDEKIRELKLRALENEREREPPLASTIRMLTLVNRYLGIEEYRNMIRGYRDDIIEECKTIERLKRKPEVRVPEIYPD